MGWVRASCGGVPRLHRTIQLRPFQKSVSRFRLLESVDWIGRLLRPKEPLDIVKSLVGAETLPVVRTKNSIRRAQPAPQRPKTPIWPGLLRPKRGPCHGAGLCSRFRPVLSANRAHLLASTTPGSDGGRSVAMSRRCCPAVWETIDLDLRATVKPYQIRLLVPLCAKLESTCSHLCSCSPPPDSTDVNSLDYSTPVLGLTNELTDCSTHCSGVRNGND